MTGVPSADVEVDVVLIRRLLADQVPALAGQPVTVVATGWDNVIARVGDDHAMRVPRRSMADRLALHEQAALAELAGSLPLPVPVPVHTGRPTAYYPHHWSVVPWLEGVPAADAGVDPVVAVDQLASFLTAMHRSAPAGAPDNPYRGIPLSDRVDRAAAQLLELVDLGLLDPDEAVAATAELTAAAAVPAWPGPKVWVHGDLHARNVLLDEDGGISAVIDFGDVHAGDPAVDLIAAWYLLPPAHHARLRHRTAVDDDSWARGRGWTIALAAATAPTAATVDRPFADAAIAGLRRILSTSGH